MKRVITTPIQMTKTLNDPLILKTNMNPQRSKTKKNITSTKIR